MDKTETNILSQGKQKKAEIVSKLLDKIGKAKSLVFADYCGLTHKQLEELRENINAQDGTLMVSKNRLLLRALGDKRKKLADIFTGPTAILCSRKDEVRPLKELVRYFQKSGFGKLKGGLFGEKYLGEEELVRLSKLPDKNTLIALFIRQLNAPIQGLHYALSWNLNKLVWALQSVKEKRDK